jgi:hypothetical protein
MRALSQLLIQLKHFFNFSNALMCFAKMGEAAASRLSVSEIAS